MDTKSAGFSLFSKSMQQRILAEQLEVKPEAVISEQPEVETLSDEDFWAKSWEESMNDDFSNEVRFHSSDLRRMGRR